MAVVRNEPINTAHSGYHGSYKGRNGGHGPTLGPVIDFDPRKVQNAFAVQARDILGQFTSAQGAVLAVNRRSLAWIQERAAENLDASIAEHGKDQDYNSGNLRRAILNDQFSTADRDGFQFMRDDLTLKAVPYYRAIESGSDFWVGKRVKLAFPDQPAGARFSDFADDFGADLGPVVGPRQRRALGMKGRILGVKIRNPVPAYQYGHKAFVTFQSRGLYKRWIKQELKSLGLSLVG